MAVITIILGAGFLFAILFLIKTTSLPSYLQAAQKGLRGLFGILLIIYFSIWAYQKATYRYDLTSKDFYGNWELNTGKNIFQINADSSFYEIKDQNLYKGKWTLNNSTKHLSLFYFEKLNTLLSSSQAEYYQESYSANKSFEIAYIHNDRIRFEPASVLDLFDIVSYLTKVSMPYSLKEKFENEKLEYKRAIQLDKNVVNNSDSLVYINEKSKPIEGEQESKLILSGRYTSNHLFQGYAEVYNFKNNSFFEKDIIKFEANDTLSHFSGKYKLDFNIKSLILDYDDGSFYQIRIAEMNENGIKGRKNNKKFELYKRL